MHTNPMRQVSILPAGPGWRLEYDGLEGALFASAAKAEEAASRLVKALADCGEKVSIEVRIRDRHLASPLRPAWT